MHLGNVYAALMSWLYARRAGGRWILRIEDLDPQRSRPEYAVQLQEDLLRLGLEWDEGGTVGDKAQGKSAPYVQSLRGHLYEQALERLRQAGLVYPCRCTRAEVMATQAPHQSDGRIVYPGTCRPAIKPFPTDVTHAQGNLRIYVPDMDIRFTDGIAGVQTFNPAKQCGDFVIRRRDGAWAYQLAVVVDDALMGVNQVVRGNDLLLSTAQQIYLYRLLDYPVPEFFHLPLLTNAQGQRLSKRDGSLSLEYLFATLSPQQIIGKVAYLAGLIPYERPCTPEELLNGLPANISYVLRQKTIPTC